MNAVARAFEPLNLQVTELDRAGSSAFAANASPIDLTIVTTRADFDALEAEWNALFERAGRPAQMFQTFNWNWHWANHYLAASPDGRPGPSEGISLSIIIARRNGRLIMVWPLVRERRRGVTQIFWMGEPVSQYGDVLIDAVADAEHVLRQGLSFLVANARGDLLRLRHVRADAAVAPLLKEIGATPADRHIAPFMDLRSAASFADFEQRYSARSRRNRRRLARRLEEQGTYAFERFHGGSQARAAAIEAIAFKEAWLKNRGLVSNAIADARMSALFADVAEGREKSTNCVVSALKSNGETAALEVSFACKGHLAMHVIAFNLKFEKSGAGVLLLEQGLKDGYADRLDVFDMLAPGDPYKLDWCDLSIDVIDWVKPLSLTGFAYARVYLRFLRPRLKIALKAMPQSLRRLVRDGYSQTVST